MNEPPRGAVPDLLYLVGCALRGETPAAERIRDMDLGRVFAEAGRHMLAGAAAAALDAARVSHPAFRQAEAKAIRRCVAQQAEYRRVAAEMDARGIRHAPLKGLVLQGLYPRAGMREMSDCDVLCDPARMEAVRGLMEDLGYSVRQFGSWCHDVYVKEPLYFFEMHRSLFSDYPKEANRGKDVYYRDVFSRLLPDGEGGSGLRFSPEDFLLYLAAHAHKHHEDRGTGLRLLADLYVLDTRGPALNEAYVAREAEKLCIAGFLRTARSLADACLSGAPRALTEEESALLSALSSAGVYGQEANFVRRGLKAAGKGPFPRLRYICARIGTPPEVLREAYPFFARHPLLRPALPFVRLVRKLRQHPAQLRAELRALFSRKT